MFHTLLRIMNSLFFFILSSRGILWSLFGTCTVCIVLGAHFTSFKLLKQHLSVDEAMSRLYS